MVGKEPQDFIGLPAKESGLAADSPLSTDIEFWPCVMLR